LALENYEKFLTKNNNSIDALWRISMAHYYIGHVLKKSSNREKHFRLGVKTGKKCAELSKRQSVECIFWLATNTALLNKEHGILSLAFGIGHMIDLFEEARKLNPDYASAGPYRMLALLYYKAPGFLGGDKKKALSYIKQSIEKSPNEPLNVYFYMTFLLDKKKSDEAMKIANDFSKKANPKTFPFYESHSAYRKINYFIAHKSFPKTK
jgi:tetratricopeptide (TPR) repeat protein